MNSLNQKSLGDLRKNEEMFQRVIIQEKLETINCFCEDITFMTAVKEKTINDKLIFKINDYIEFMREYVKELGKSMKFNEEIINEIRRRQRIRDNIIDRDDARIEPKENKRDEGDEPLSLFG